MPVKCTFFFDFDKYGWSESHYFMNGNDFATAKPLAFILAQKRAQLLGGTVLLSDGQSVSPALNYIRLSIPVALGVTGTQRNAELVTETTLEVSRLGLVNNLIGPTTVEPTIFENVSLRCRGEAAGPPFAILYLGGCPDDLFNGSNDFKFSAIGGYQAAFQSFQRELTSGRWGFRALTPTQTYPVSSIGVSAVPPANLTVTVAAAFTPIIGSFVQLRGFTSNSRSIKPLNGRYQVVSLNAAVGPPAGTVITLGNSAGRDPTGVARYGTVQQVAFAPVPYQNFFATGVSSRKRGVGSDRPVGRRRAAKAYAG